MLSFSNGNSGAFVFSHYWFETSKLTFERPPYPEVSAATRRLGFPNVDNQVQVSNNIINNQSNKDNSKIEFFDEVMAFENYSKEMLNDFFEYWSEPTKKGIMKKDTMKTWATSRRLKTWAKNESKWALNSVGISKVDKHLQTHNEAMNILKQIENDKKNK